MSEEAVAVEIVVMVWSIGFDQAPEWFSRVGTWSYLSCGQTSHRPA